MWRRNLIWTDMLSVSVMTAYRIMHELNDEFKADGYITADRKYAKTLYVKSEKIITEKATNQEL